MLPSLDLEEPNIVVLSDTKGILVPKITVRGDNVEFSLNVNPLEPLDWYYNSVVTVYVKYENVVMVDGKRETMLVGDVHTVKLGITTEELTYM